MRIVMDLQGAQSTGSRTRGIGRYTRSLAHAIVEQAPGHEFVIVLNGRFPESVDEIQALFKNLLPLSQFHIWTPPQHSFDSSPAIVRAKEALHEAFIASLRPDVVYVSSLFEGLSDAAVSSIGTFANRRTAVTLYDLIPLLNAKPYLENPVVRGWYMRKIDALMRADMWFAISESSRQEGITALGLPEDRCINVSTAAYGHFQSSKPDSGRENELRRTYGLRGPFVMYTGGIDHRKNLDGLIRAFHLLPDHLKRTHQLAIVCSIQPSETAHFQDIARTVGLHADQLILTGYVPERDLIDLYNLCTLFVFPSIHEGFGLPALEAMHCGVPVIASNTSSLPEVIGRTDALFDPRNDGAIASAMERALVDESFRASLASHGVDQARKFSWQESAKRAIAGLESLYADTQIRPAASTKPFRRPRLAYLSPQPPEKSGIATYSAELLPELQRHYDIVLITDLATVDEPTLTSIFPICSIDWFKANSGLFDRVIYHFGNSSYHDHMFTLLEKIPGVVVLHDFFLSGALVHQELSGADPGSWTRALYRSHGYGAVRERLVANDLTDCIYKYPCNLDALVNARGIIVHSHYSKSLAEQWYGKGFAAAWRLIPHLRVAPIIDPSAKRRARQDLGLHEDEFLVCSFGIMAPTKLNHRLLDAWLASSLANDPSCRLVFVGAHPGGDYAAGVAERISRCRTGSVDITGWASAETFSRYLAAADGAVQLRGLSRGETSGTVLDTMAHGVPTIVNANGSMADLPSDAVVMLPDEFEDQALIQALERLRHNPKVRSALSDAGVRAINSSHSPRECAAAYRNAIEEFSEPDAPGRAEFVLRIRNGVESLCISNRAGELIDLARATTTALPLRRPFRSLFIDIGDHEIQEASDDRSPELSDIVRELLLKEPEGFRVEPVAWDGFSRQFRHAHRMALALIDCESSAFAESPITVRQHDILITQAEPSARFEGMHDVLREARQANATVIALATDSCLPFDGPWKPHSSLWLDSLKQASGILASSVSWLRHVQAFLQCHPLPRLCMEPLHFGSDGSTLKSHMVSLGQPSTVRAEMARFAKRASFLVPIGQEPDAIVQMVIAAFDYLWSKGHDVGLIFASVEASTPTVIVQHTEFGHRLEWLVNFDAGMLSEFGLHFACLVLLDSSTAGETFLEAARNFHLPVIANTDSLGTSLSSNEVCSFQMDRQNLSLVVENWLKLAALGNEPRPRRTWNEITHSFVAATLAIAEASRIRLRQTPA